MDRRGKGHVHTSLSHLPLSFPAHVPHKEITAFTITPNLSASSPYQELTYLKHLVSFCHLPSCRARSKLLESTCLCGSPTWPQHTDNIFVSQVLWSSPVALAHKRQKAGGSEVQDQRGNPQRSPVWKAKLKRKHIVSLRAPDQAFSSTSSDKDASCHARHWLLSNPCRFELPGPDWLKHFLLPF